MVCLSCVHFEEKVVAGAKGRVGRCSLGVPAKSGYKAFVSPEWCGEHETKEDREAKNHEDC